MRTDSTTAPPPPENQGFSSANGSWLLDTRKDTIIVKKKSTHTCFLVCKGLSIDDVDNEEHRVSADTTGSWF